MNRLAAISLQTWIGSGALFVVASAAIAGYAHLSSRYAALAQANEDIQAKNVELSDGLYAAQQGLAVMQERFGGFETQVGDISGTVDLLEKLKDTDRELLQKYSKVFFLNEHYTPPRLSQIEAAYAYNETRPERIHAQVRPYLEEMLNDANDAGVELYVRSSYRSFEEQKALKSAYTVAYGAGSANAFSADQGYSEHQLGTTLDFSGSRNESLTESFDKSRAFAWLVDNAHTYGFVLSYPKGNAYYMYEPWHWRFVGRELAGDLYKKSKYFYDLEQREIDEYLPTIFD